MYEMSCLYQSHLAQNMRITETVFTIYCLRIVFACSNQDSEKEIAVMKFVVGKTGFKTVNIQLN